MVQSGVQVGVQTHDGNKTELNFLEIVFLSPTVSWFLCVSVSQLYPVSAFHADDQKMGFQKAGEQTTADRDFRCPSGSKI